eukprot:337759-Pelagomonas_calceolata.AAC.2
MESLRGAHAYLPAARGKKSPAQHSGGLQVLPVCIPWYPPSFFYLFAYLPAARGKKSPAQHSGRLQVLHICVPPYLHYLNRLLAYLPAARGKKSPPRRPGGLQVLHICVPPTCTISTTCLPTCQQREVRKALHGTQEACRTRWQTLPCGGLCVHTPADETQDDQVAHSLCRARTHARENMDGQGLAPADEA